MSTPSTEAAVRRRLINFYDFRRTLCCCCCCCCCAAASGSFLRLQADALLLLCGGVCFHFYDFNGRSVAAVQRRLVHFYDIAFI